MKKRWVSLVLSAILIFGSGHNSVADAAGQNVALHKPVIVSGIYDKNNIGENAVDGNVNTNWANGSTRLDGVHCIIVDLEGTYEISGVTARSRRDMDQTYNRSGWEVYVASSEDFSDAVFLGRKQSAGAFKEDFEIVLSTAVYGRYVKVQSTNDIVLSEVEVYGSQMDGNNSYEDIPEEEISDVFPLIEYLSLLEPLNAKTFGYYNLITRAEAAQICLKTANVQPHEYHDGFFSDVTEATAYASAISTCAEMGYISCGGTFRPDAYITVAEFCTMLERVLGYGTYIEVFGGFPNGAYRLADEIGLLDDSDQSFYEGLNRKNAIMILYQALTGQIARDWNPELEYIISQNITLLEHAFGYELKCGVVYETSVTTLQLPQNFGKNHIKIGDDILISQEKHFDDFLGQSVYYITDEQNTVLYSCWLDNRRTTVLTFEMDDIVALEPSRIVVEQDGHKKSYSLNRENLLALRNGIAYVDFTSLEEYTDFCGKIQLIDNDGNDQFDILHFWEPVAFVLDYAVIEENSYRLGGKNGEVVSSDDVSTFFVYNQEKRQIEASSLGQGLFVYIYQSDNGAYTKVEVSDKTAEGIVSEIGQDYMILNETRYSFSYYYQMNKEKIGGLDLEKTAEVFLDGEERVVWVTYPEETNGKIAFIMQMDGGSVFGSVPPQVKLYTEDGEFVTYSFAPRVTVDGTRWDTEKFHETMEKDPGYFEGKYAIYRLNADGLVSFIDTENYNAEDEPDSRMIKSNVQIDTETLFFDVGFFKGNYMVVPAHSDMKIFTIPYQNDTALTSEENYKFYKVNTCYSTYWRGDLITTPCVLYGQDQEFGYPLFGTKKVNINSGSGDLEYLQKATDLLLVERITKTLDESGMDCYAVRGYNLITDKKGTWTLNFGTEDYIKHSDIFMDIFDGSIPEAQRPPATWINANGTLNMNAMTKEELSDYMLSVNEIQPGDILACEMVDNSIVAAEVAYRTQMAEDGRKGIMFTMGANALTRVTANILLKGGRYTKIKDGYLELQITDENTEVIQYGEVDGSLYVVENGKVYVESTQNLPSLAEPESILALSLKIAEYRSMVLYK